MQRDPVLPRPIRIATALVMLPMAAAYGFLAALISKVPDWGVVIAWVTMAVGSLYGTWLGCYVLWHHWKMDDKT